jgi:hypothetical protein
VTRPSLPQIAQRRSEYRRARLGRADYGRTMIRRADPSEAHALATLHRSSIVAHCSAAYSVEHINAWIAEIQPEAYSVLINDAEVLVATEMPGAPCWGLACAPRRSD